MRSVAFHLNCLTHGGTERVVSNLANRFAGEGYQVYVATEWEDEDEFPLDPRIKRVHVGLREGDERKSRVTQFLLRIRYLRAFLREYRPDVIVAFMRRANYRALMATRRIRIPAVISVRIDPAVSYVSFSDRVQIRWLFPKAAGAVFQTGEQQRFFEPWLPKNARVILNPIHEKYTDAPETTVRERAVVHAARLVDFKDQPTLIRAFLQVHEKHPDVQLRMYGPDSGDGTKEICEGLIREYHAEDWILLCGSSDKLEIDLPKGLCFVSSSLFEGLPNAVLEAMALGLPVISTDCPCGGPAEVIRDGENGLLVPVGDAAAMAAAMNRLIEDRDLAERLGREARRIRETAGMQAVFSEWRDYLEKIVAEY
ncbi:MAG: glycosyltransferase [Lachnospiraceae bacterium]|nr:glycosyltransferase [Lachnospiraceae bacterium]